MVADWQGRAEAYQRPEDLPAGRADVLMVVDSLSKGAEVNKATMVLIVVVGMGAGFVAGNIFGTKTENKAWSLKWAGRDNADLKASNDRQKAETAKANQLQQDKEKAEHEATQREATIRGQLAVATRESDGLRDAFRRYKQQHGASQGSSTVATSGGSGSIDLQSVVFAEVDQRSGDLAIYADQLRSALTQCQVQYNSVASY